MDGSVIYWAIGGGFVILVAMLAVVAIARGMEKTAAVAGRSQRNTMTAPDTKRRLAPPSVTNRFFARKT